MLYGEYPRNQALLFINYSNALLWLALSCCREYTADAADIGRAVLCGVPSQLTSAFRKMRMMQRNWNLEATKGRSNGAIQHTVRA